MKNKTEIISSMGRNHLLVNGYVVASQGEICRDPELVAIFEQDTWTISMLEFVTIDGPVRPLRWAWRKFRTKYCRWPKPSSTYPPST